ncbi:MAG: hypothetical protein KBG02_02065, partial [Haliscomenobacter sp.]|nr:hypothetical protein [Haliscomenobacter sp.]
MFDIIRTAYREVTASRKALVPAFAQRGSASIAALEILFSQKVGNQPLGKMGGLSQKTVFAPGGQKIFSFFNSNKKL